MGTKNSKQKKVLLIVEDDPAVRVAIKKIFDQYNEIEIKDTDGPDKAWDILFSDNATRPAVLILDTIMPYGGKLQELNGHNDPLEIETGLRLLERLRNHEQEHRLSNIWTAIVTARSDPTILDKLYKQLGCHGRIYLKPFNDIELENDVAAIFGIDSKIPDHLLPKGYTPPTLQKGDTQ